MNTTLHAEIARARGRVMRAMYAAERAGDTAKAARLCEVAFELYELWNRAAK